LRSLIVGFGHSPPWLGWPKRTFRLRRRFIDLVGMCAAFAAIEFLAVDDLSKTHTGHSPKLPNDHRKVESSPSISPEADFLF
jgi:hypothetical protein